MQRYVDKLTNLQCLKLRQGETLEGQGDVLGAAPLALCYRRDQLKVVIDHGDEILGDLDVELYNVRSGRDCVLEGSYGVLPNVGTAVECGPKFSNLVCLENGGCIYYLTVSPS